MKNHSEHLNITNEQLDKWLAQRPMPDLTATKFKTVKQPPGSRICGQAVVAMVCGHTIDESYEYLREIGVNVDVDCELDPNLVPYHAWPSHMAMTLASKHIIMGSVVSTKSGDHMSLSGIGIVDIEVHTTCPMIMAVKSETLPGLYHWVLWDGKCVRDPNPSVPDERPISDYDDRIAELFPLTACPIPA